MNTRHLRPDDLRGRRWRALVRESTEAQAEKWSPERQRADLRRAAEELGLLPAAPLFYERTGSGEAEHASEVAQALADARRGEYDVLLVLHTSRLARNRAEAIRVKREAQSIGLVLYFTSQRIVSGSREGQLIEGINEVIDEHANEDRRFWVAGGLRTKQLAGRWVGRIPYGYRGRMADNADGSRTWDGGLVADEEAAPIVRRIFEEYLSGVGARQIAVRLNADGLRGPDGDAWDKRIVLTMIGNPAYKGTLVRYRRHDPKHYYAEEHPADGRQEALGDWPALIDPVLWDRAAEVRAERSQVTSTRVRAYPMSSVLRCSACGRRMTGAFSGRTRYYRCSGRVNLGTCAAPGIRADAAERAFSAWLNRYRLPSDWRARVVALRTRVERDEAQARRERLTAQLVRLRNLYQWGEMPDAEYRAAAADIRAELAAIAPVQPEGLAEAAAALVEIGSRWSRLSAERQKALPPMILRDAVVRDGAVDEWVVRAELRPLLEACEVPDLEVGSRAREYIVRYAG